MDKIVTQDVETGNKIIAEFMGHGGSVSDEWNNKPANYHSSWDWLMPAVEKIEKFPYADNVDIGEKWCTILCDGRNRIEIYKEADSKIKAVWLAVIEFINWYNKNLNHG